MQTPCSIDVSCVLTHRVKKKKNIDLELIKQDKNR